MRSYRAKCSGYELLMKLPFTGMVWMQEAPTVHLISVTPLAALEALGLAQVRLASQEVLRLEGAIGVAARLLDLCPIASTYLRHYIMR